MATRSTIAVQHADGTVSQIYAHWDGYLSHNGRILFEAYNTQERAEALVALGDISSLDRSIEQPAGHSFNKPVEGCTVFYGRDRGEEDQGVRFWGFGKNVYQELLSIISDADYGDITDPVNGRDIVVEFRTAEESGKSFPETTIRVKPNTSVAIDPSKKDLLGKQTNILDLFPELSYDQLKAVMDAWLNPETSSEPSVNAVADEDGDVEAVAPVAPTSNKSPSASASKSNTEDLTKAFDNLFNS